MTGQISSWLCMAAVVGINSGHSVSFYTQCGNQPGKSKLALYKPLLHCNNHLILYCVFVNFVGMNFRGFY